MFFLWVIRMWIHYPVQTGVHKHGPIAPQGPEHSSVIGEVNERGKREYARKKDRIRNGTKYLPVILERSDGKRTTFRGAKRRCKSEWVPHIGSRYCLAGRRVSCKKNDISAALVIGFLVHLDILLTYGIYYILIYILNNI